MLAELPREIDSQREPDGWTYRLPPRDLGRTGRLARWLSVLGGLMVICLVASAGLAAYRFSQLGKIDTDTLWVAIPFVIFGLPMFGVSCSVFTLGRRLGSGYHTLALRGEKLISTGHPRLLRRRRRTFRVESVNGLRIDGPGDLPFPLPAKLRDLAVLRAETSKDPVVIAWGYPRAWLIALAHHLAQGCHDASPARLRDRPIPVEIDTPEATEKRIRYQTVGLQSAPDASAAGPPPQPRTSIAVLTETTDGCSVEMPALGLRRVSKTLFFMGIGFTVITLAVSVSLLTAEIEMPDDLSPIWAVLFFVVWLTLFGGAGVGMLLASINASRRRGIIDLVGGNLVVSQRSLFGVKQFQWKHGELERVSVGPSGTEINNEPVMNLHFESRTGKTVKLFSERPDAELEWLAALIRYHLSRAPR